MSRTTFPPRHRPFWPVALIAMLTACATPVRAFCADAVQTFDFIDFEYTQTDKDTGSGTLSGTIDGIAFNGVMPKATVIQNDQSGLPVPPGMIGYMDGVSAVQPGNPFGVYLGFDGQVVTLQGERDGVPYEMDVPLVSSADEYIYTPGGGFGSGKRN